VAALVGLLLAAATAVRGAAVTGLGGEGREIGGAGTVIDTALLEEMVNDRHASIIHR
jgi:hypothetical protein